MRSIRIMIAPLVMAAVLLGATGTFHAVRAAEWGQGVQQSEEPDFYLSFTPALPGVNREVVVSIVAKNGFPPNSTVRWNVSGAPFGDSGVKDNNPASYAFTPVAPGVFVITAELNVAGSLTSVSTLELVIAPDMPAQNMDSAAPIGDISLDLDPSLPRVGRDATFTFRYGSGIPENGEVRWDISGGQFSNVRIQGRNKEICTFVPDGQGQYFVKAVLAIAGRPTGEITLQFLPMP